jgi:hypothetical protein
MKYPRVNLLERDERRYQGVVSHRMILLSIAIIPTVVSLLFFMIGLVAYKEAHSNWGEVKKEWTTVKPQFDRFRQALKAQNEARRALALMKGWRDAGVDFSTLLLDIQKKVPPTIQLKSLEFAGKSGDEPFSDPDACSVNYEMEIHGISVGDRAEASVIGFRRDLMAEDSAVASVFHSIKLSSMRKKPAGDGESIREFSIEGTSEEGDRL